MLILKMACHYLHGSVWNTGTLWDTGQVIIHFCINKIVEPNHVMVPPTEKVG